MIPAAITAAIAMVAALAGAVIFWPRGDNTRAETAPTVGNSTPARSTPQSTSTPDDTAPPATPPSPPSPNRSSRRRPARGGLLQGLPGDWFPEQGKWRVVDGRLQATTDKARARISFGPQTPENFRIDTLVRFVKVKDATRWLNIGVDYHAADDWGAVFVVRSDTTAGNGLELAQRGPGAEAKFISDPIAGAPSAIGVGKDHWLAIEVRDHTIEAWIDGQYVFGAENLRRTDGSFGFVINNATVQFDNVKITELND